MKKILHLSRLLLVLGLFTFCISVSEARSQDVIGEILRRMDAHNKAIQSLKADITWVKTDPNLGAAGIDTILGNITYVPKSRKGVMRARLNWTNPMEEWVVVKGNAFKSFRPRINQGYQGKADKSTERTGGALSFLNMSKEQLNANYKVRFIGKEPVKGGIGTWRLELTPRTPQSYQTAEMWIDSDGMPRQIKVIQRNNDTSTFLLSNIKKNERVDPHTFELDLPKKAVMKNV